MAQDTEATRARVQARGKPRPKSMLDKLPAAPGGKAKPYVAPKVRLPPAPRSEARDTKGDADRAPARTAAPAGDTKGSDDRSRTETYKSTSRYRRDLRDTYAEQELAQRREILQSAKLRPNGAGARAAVEVHGERTRAADALAALRHWQGHPAASTIDEQVLKGARVARHLQANFERRQRAAQSAEVRGALGALSADVEPLKHLHFEDEDKPKGGVVTAGLGFVGKIRVPGIGPVAASLADDLRRRIQGEAPVNPAEIGTLRGTYDASQWGLRQLSRGSSASAGAALAGIEGENVARGAWEGLKSNDRSYTQVAEKLGMHGAPAAVVGLVGDVVLDPTTYLSFGFKTPAEAAELASRTGLVAKYSSAAERAAAAGDKAAQEEVAAGFRRDLEAAVADARKLDGSHKGIQAGVRLPGGKTFATSGKLTSKVGAASTGRAAEGVQQNKYINELLRKFSPAQTPTGVDRGLHRDLRDTEREAAALQGRVARDARHLGVLVKNTVKGDNSKVRAIVDAIEAGTTDALPADLRKVAEHATALHADVAGRYEKITGRPLQLVDTVLKPGEVDDALKLGREVLGAQVKKATRDAEALASRADDLAQRIAVDDAKLGARTSERAGLAPDRAAPAESAAQALRKFEHAATTAKAQRSLDDADKLAGRLDGVEAPRTAAEQQDVATELASRLDDVLETVRSGVRTNQARTRTNDYLGAVRRGDETNDELATALADADRFTADARAAQSKGDRTAARRADAAARQARAVIARHRDEIHARFEGEIAAEPVELRGKPGRLEDQLDQMLSRVAEPAPVGYVPRAPQKYAERMFDPNAEITPGLAARADVDHLNARVDRRRQEAIRNDPEVDEAMRPSDELAALEAKYGANMGRKLSQLSLHKHIVQKMAAPASTRLIDDAEGMRIFHVADDGQLSEIPAGGRREVYARAEAAEAEAHAADTTPVYDHVLVPDGVADSLSAYSKVHGGSEIGNLYDRTMRAWKAANTILRPAFFATSVLGNLWQGFLVDAGAEDFAQAFRHWQALRSEVAEATGSGDSMLRQFMRWASDTTDVVDGREMHLADLLDEGIEAGAVRAGSRNGDVTDLSLEQHAQRRLAGGAGTQAVEWLNQLAEDVDDVTRLMLYRRARAKLGYSPRQATEYVFSTMVDYGDLTPFERKVMKRLLPFYTYTSRNVPIQIRRIAARPGKLATFEKVRQSLAAAAGLQPGWESELAEGDQERNPFPVPGLKFNGFQAFAYLRLPVDDLARPAQVLEGPKGLGRIAERYGSDVNPALKAPFELHFNRRWDYDRPLNVPGMPPPSGVLERLAGLSENRPHVDAQGRPYHGVDGRVDYLLRSVFGSYGSAALNVGKEAPDSSNIPTSVRMAAGLGAGVGLNAPDPLKAVALPEVSDALAKLYDKRTDLQHRPGGQFSDEWYKLADQISDRKDLRDVVRAAVGYQKEKAGLPKMRLEHLSRLGSRQSPHMRSLMHRLNAIAGGG